jgi:hypothetical protein
MQWRDEEVYRITLRLPLDVKEKIQKKIDKYYIRPSLNSYIIKALLKTIDQDIPF